MITTRNLLPSTLSHAQVCSTIVDRISSGLPFFPYYQHFSSQTPFKQIALFSYQLLFFVKLKLPSFWDMLHLGPDVMSLNCFLCCSIWSILFRFSKRKHYTETKQHLLALDLRDYWSLSSCKLGVHMTQDIPFSYTAHCDTLSKHALPAVPAPKQKGGHCFVVVAKPSLLKESSHAPMTAG